MGRAPPPEPRASTAAKAVRSWVGAGTLASHTWLPLRYRQQQPQHASTARGRRERSVPSPAAREGGGGGYGRGDPAAPRPGRTSHRAPARRGPAGAVRAWDGWLVASNSGGVSARLAVHGIGPDGRRAAPPERGSKGLVRPATGSWPRPEGPPARAAAFPATPLASPATFPGFPRHRGRRPHVRPRMGQPGGSGMLNARLRRGRRSVPAAHFGEQSLPIPLQIRTPAAPER
ncbi:unnamed protein product [Coccothraustes coccothraustes]